MKGLYNRPSILLNKSKKQVNKNHTFSVSLTYTSSTSSIGEGIRRDSRWLEEETTKNGCKYLMGITYWHSKCMSSEESRFLGIKKRRSKLHRLSTKKPTSWWSFKKVKPKKKSKETTIILKDAMISLWKIAKEQGGKKLQRGKIWREYRLRTYKWLWTRRE